MSNLSASRVPHFIDSTGSSTGLVVSCVLHAVLLTLIIVGWTPAEKPRESVRPRYIEAKLLQMKPAVAQAAKPKPQPKPVEKPVPKPQPKVDDAAQKAEEQKKVEEQKRQEQVKKEQQAKAEAERKHQELVKQEQQAKAAAEKKRQEEVRKAEQAEAEKKRQEEKKRQDELRRQQELANALDMEDEMLDEEEAESQVGTYVDYMASLIASNWSRPPSARRGMEVMLEISLGAAGRVTNVRVVKSSGNAAFDLSAEQAVKKVGQFSRLREMDAAIYQRDFRRINILFRPDDLRM